MRNARSIVALALAFGVVGCSAETTEPRESESLDLSPIGESGVSGTAVITDESGDVSTVEVELTGLEPNTQHAGHVHVGSCADQGAIVMALEPVTADSEGNGTAVTPGVPDDQLTTDFYVQYHVSFDPPGAPIACADIGLETTPPTEVPGY